MEEWEIVFWGLSWLEWEKLSIILRNLVLIGGVIGAGVALFLNWRRTNNDTNRLAQQDTQLENDRVRLENDRRRLANDTYVKAIEQLGSTEQSVRLGAIYALERIAIEEERYHWPIMETLCAYVRERAPWQGPEPEAAAHEDQPPPEPSANGSNNPPIDIQAAITVIGRRTEDRQSLEADRSQRLDLRHADLRHADLRNADMRGGAFARGQFSHSSLDRADLSHAHLERAHLGMAHLERAKLNDAHLEGAFLFMAHLEEARLFGAHLEGAHLSRAHLEGASLSGARLEGAK
ncbi:MAG: pentapeptide repeat-containing protein, partial [Alphaproteobacteria bacterium]